MKPAASISVVLVLSRNKVTAILDLTSLLSCCCDYKWQMFLMLVHVW